LHFSYPFIKVEAKSISMNPKQFLIIGGIVLVVVGLLGMAGVLGPSADQSLFGPWWWFDTAENWAHLVLGIAALAVAFGVPSLGAPVTLIVGIVGVLVGLWGFAGYQNLLGANLENPLDNILHVGVGIWALFAWWKGKESMSGSSMMESGMNM
jgi:hypothetical protein